MTYTVQDFQKDYVREHLNLLSPDERLRDLSPEQRLRDLSPDEILGNLSPESLKILMEKLGKQ